MVSFYFINMRLNFMHLNYEQPVHASMLAYLDKNFDFAGRAGDTAEHSQRLTNWKTLPEQIFAEPADKNGVDGALLWNSQRSFPKQCMSRL